MKKNMLLSVLKRVRDGERCFEPGGQASHDLIKFQPIANALLAAYQRKFLHEIKAHPNHTTGDKLYDEIQVVGGLSHDGEKYLNDRLNRIITVCSVILATLVISMLGLNFAVIFEPESNFWGRSIRFLLCGIGGGLAAASIRLMIDLYNSGKRGSPLLLILAAIFAGGFVGYGFDIKVLQHFVPYADPESTLGSAVFFTSVFFSLGIMGIEMIGIKLFSGE